MNAYGHSLALLVLGVSLAVSGAPAAAAAATDFGEITETGPGVEISVAEPGQTAEVHFTGSVGRRLSLGFTFGTFEGIYNVSVIRPDGTTQVNAQPLVGINSELDLAALTQAGTYRVIVDPANTGSATITLSAEVPGGSLSPSGPGTPVSLDRPGQNARYQFAGAVGQRLSLGFTFGTLDGIYNVSVVRPNGTIQVNAQPLVGINSDLDLAVLTVAGTYDVVIDPTAPGTGSLTTTLSQEVAGGTLSPSGPGVPVALDRPGQNARFQLAGAVGQRFSLGFTGVTLDGIYNVSVIRPDGTTQVSAQPLIGANSELDLAVLTQAGTYDVVVDPTAPGTGSFTTTLSREVAGGPLSPTAPAVPVTIDRPGQNARLQLTGTTGQRYSLGFTGVTLDGIYNVSIIRPDGTNHVSAQPLIGTDAELDIPALTLAGTYDVVIDPTAPGTGAVTVTLSLEVAGGTLTVGGPGLTATIDRPGQNARFVFSGTAGQQVTLAFTGVTFGGLYNVSVIRPDGTTHATRILLDDGTTALPALTLAGMYQVVVDPDSAATGSVTAALSATSTA